MHSSNPQQIADGTVAEAEETAHYDNEPLVLRQLTVH